MTFIFILFVLRYDVKQQASDITV